MIEHLIAGGFYLCVAIVVAGAPLCLIGYAVEFAFDRKPPRSACRDWRDNARGRR